MDTRQHSIPAKPHNAQNCDAPTQFRNTDEPCRSRSASPMLRTGGAKMSTLLPNSPAARDVAYHVHPQTNLRKLKEEGPLVVTRGEGCRIFDDTGKDYIEAAAGLWCASLGFTASERLARAAYDQMRQLGYYHTFRQASHPVVIDLAEKLLSIAPMSMSKAIFQCSGSEANDTAIKLIWYYHHAMGHPEKMKIIGRKGGYHGNTIAAVSVSGRPDMHGGFGLPLPMMRHTEMPHYYRFHEEGESEEEFATRMADALICGFGRSGNWWGSQTFGIEPDMMSCAKALSAAFQPISALLVSDRIYQAMLAAGDKQGSFAHGYTHAGHPVTAAVALETLRIYQEMDVVGHTRRVGAHLLRELMKSADHPLVGDIRGVGLLCGVELVQDKKSRAPYAPARRVGGIID